MKISLFLLSFQLFFVQLFFAQNNADLKLYQTVRHIVKDSLKMHIDEHFFETWKNKNQPSLYTYFSKKDTIQDCDLPDSIKNQNKNVFEPFAKSKTYNDCDFLLYKTYGTSATYLTNHLLQYEASAQAFIAFHEAMHQHCINAKKRIPYIVEEALCDAFATECIKKYANLLELDDAEIVLQSAWNSAIYTHINTDIAAINRTKNTKEILKIHEKFADFLQLLLPYANKFQHERFNYPISNAYFYRYKDYAWYYFTLRKIFKNHKTPAEAVFFIQKTWDNDLSAFWKYLE